MGYDFTQVLEKVYDSDTSSLKIVVNNLRLPLVADPGTGAAIPVVNSSYVILTIGSAGAETNTLAAPNFSGQEIAITAGTVGTGTRAITSAVTINAAANTIMTFNASADFILLRAYYIAAVLKWRVILNESVTLS